MVSVFDAVLEQRDRARSAVDRVAALELEVAVLLDDAQPALAVGARDALVEAEAEAELAGRLLRELELDILLAAALV